MNSAVVLSSGMASLVLFGTFFALLVARVPVAFALGLASLPVLIIEPRLSPMVIFNEMFKSYNSFILLSVPFFLLTANLMNVGGDRKSTRLNSSHSTLSRMPSSA